MSKTVRGRLVAPAILLSLSLAAVPAAALAEGAVTLDQSLQAPRAGAVAQADGWAQEDGSWCFYQGGSRVSGWVVSDSFPGAAGQGLQRYWLDAQGRLVQGALIEVGDGTWAYARPEGYVVRGAYAAGEGVYLADNDGRLLAPGWQVTDAFSTGLQRYYVDPQTHAARTGFFEVDGTQFFAPAATGEVLRNAVASGAAAPFCDNEGRISASGWLVTDAFGQGLQRYWFEGGRLVTGLIDEDRCGWWAFATPGGSVVRGKWADPATGLVYIADNDGRLEAPGWHVTGAYDGGALQRYYVGAETRACASGLFSVDGRGYYGLSEVGYVLRGSLTVGGVTYVADNDGVIAPVFSATVTSAAGVEERVVTSSVDGATYLFLPAYADLSSVSLDFSLFSPGGLLVSLDGSDEFSSVESGSALDLSGLPRDADGARILRFKLSADAPAMELKVMRSETVRSVHLTSADPVNEGRPFVDGSADHSAKAKGSMTLVNADGSVVYDGALTQIKGRGNSTWRFSDKKPYQIKLDEKTDLLETGNEDNENKTWVLLANATDSARLRNTVAYDLALALGLETAPESAPVDLYYDGEYRGTYLLSEKVEINDGRVDIHKLEDDNEEANPGVELDELPLAQATNRYGQTFQYVQGMANPADISGGYLMELDIAYYGSERCWFTTTAGAFVVKEPENLSYEQMLYISERMQEAINASDPELAAPGTSASDYIDVESFAQTYMVNQFAKNIDWHASSSYFYLPAAGDAEKRGLDDVIYAGPVWDFDTAFGIRTGAEDAAEWRETSGLMFTDAHRVWFARCPEVVSAVERIAQESGNALAAALGSRSGSSAIDSVTEMAAEVSASEAMDEVLWGYESFVNCIDPLPTFEENVEFLRSWVERRAAWLSANGWTAR